MGYAGLASASCANNAEQLTTRPTAGGAQIVETNFSVGLDHAAVGGVVKEVTGCEASTACIPADGITAPTALQYPIARDLFFSSIKGFESPTVTSGELALGQCLSGTTALSSGTINSLIDANGFVSNLGNYPCCKDFKDEGCTPQNPVACTTNTDCTATPARPVCSTALHVCVPAPSNACANNNTVNMPSNACAF